MKLPNTTSSLLVVAVVALGLAACATEQTPPEAADTTAVAEAPPVDASTSAALPPRATGDVRPSPNARISQAVGRTELTFTYGRPGVKGRDVFGGLEPYGQVWRAGANEATVFHATGDVAVNGQPLAAGAYAFFAIPGEDEWTLIFNRTASQWGAFDHDEAADALRVTATPEEGPHQEWLEYRFEDLTDTSATAVLHWGTTQVPFTVSLR